jgi:hypothetical protein
MRIFEYVEQNVVDGLVLDLAGNWVPIEQALVEEVKIRHHLEMGEIVVDDFWVPMERVLQSAASPLTPIHQPAADDTEKFKSVGDQPDEAQFLEVESKNACDYFDQQQTKMLGSPDSDDTRSIPFVNEEDDAGSADSPGATGANDDSSYFTTETVRFELGQSPPGVVPSVSLPAANLLAGKAERLPQPDTHGFSGAIDWDQPVSTWKIVIVVAGSAIASMLIAGAIMFLSHAR